MEKFKVDEKISNEVFEVIIRESRSKRVLGKQMNGLFSRTRDSLHKREIQIVDEMIANELIDIESYFLCINPYVEEGKMNRRYLSSCLSEIEDAYLFRDYRTENDYMVLNKYIAFNYFKKFYKDIEWDRENSSFYIEELNLVVTNENQPISSFIYRCSRDDINLSVVGGYSDNPESIYKDKIAIRFIKPKREVFDLIYNKQSLSYNKYVNNFNDIASRFMDAREIIKYILIERNVPENNKGDIRSCAICRNLDKFTNSWSLSDFKRSGLHLLNYCTKRDRCGLEMDEFDLNSNNIECPNYIEVVEKCKNCNNDVSFNQYYLKGFNYCSNQCKEDYEERERKRREEFEKKYEKEKAKRTKQLGEVDDVFNELYLELEKLKKQD